MRINVCAELRVPGIDISKSFSAFIELDPCHFVIRAAFEKWQYSVILFEYNWGELIRIFEQNCKPRIHLLCYKCKVYIKIFVYRCNEGDLSKSKQCEMVHNLKNI